MLTGWRVLTSRGRGLIALGVIGIAAGMASDQRDVGWIGLLLLLTPIIAAVVVSRAHLHLICDRTVIPARVTLGGRMETRLRVRKQGRLPVGMLRFEERVPQQLGHRPRFSARAFTGEWDRQVTYPLDGLVRGRYRVGPLLVRAVDPFGLAQVDRRFRASNDVMVTPEIVPLGVLASASALGTSGESSPQRVGLIGTDDVMVREYRLGDDVRRIHWRSTAHKGELMVRREEQAWEPSVTLILDSREEAHGGTGRDSSFEWAVSAVASIAYHMIDAGFRVTVVDANGVLAECHTEDPFEAREAVLVALTAEHLYAQPDLRAALAATDRVQRGEMAIAVLGRLTRTDLDALANLRHGRRQGIALLLDADSFGSVTPPDAVAAHLSHSADVLSGQHWRVVTVAHGTSVADAWRAIEHVGGL